MTERYYCPVCGRCDSHTPNCPRNPNQPPPATGYRTLLASYIELRRDCIGIEELIARGADEGLTADDLKRLDKAVTVMKVGFKMTKKVLRGAGVEGTKAWRESGELAQAGEGAAG